VRRIAHPFAGVGARRPLENRPCCHVGAASGTKPRLPFGEAWESGMVGGERAQACLPGGLVNEGAKAPWRCRPLQPASSRDRDRRCPSQLGWGSPPPASNRGGAPVRRKPIWPLTRASRLVQPSHDGSPHPGALGWGCATRSEEPVERCLRHHVGGRGESLGRLRGT